MWYGFKPYVPVAQRRAQAAREIDKCRQKGQAVTPVVITGRTIATSFWGNAWCDNLEAYSDFANRLPRGRTYVRNGSVVDLQIGPGRVTAQVRGSSLYKATITIAPLPAAAWRTLKQRCAGGIGSLVELLQGRLSKSVMDIVTAQEGGLFPKPREIAMQCSCPDWAGLCKHLAAVLYGIGARLDHEPELLFRLRQVDHRELIEEALPKPGQAMTGRKTLKGSDVAEVFGIDLTNAEDREPPEEASSEVVAKPRRAARSKTVSPSRARSTKPSKAKKAASPSMRKRVASKKKPDAHDGEDAAAEGHAAAGAAGGPA